MRARVAAAVERRSAGEARRLREAVLTVDEAIARGRKCSEVDTLIALEGITTCL